MYVPIAQVSDGLTTLQNRVLPLQWEVRTNVQPFSLSDTIQRELRTASGGLPVAHIRSMDQVVVESTARTDFNTTLLTIFAGVALLLAAIGIYGLMAYSVQQRTQEIGIRMALGATSASVRGMVVRQGMLLAGDWHGHRCGRGFRIDALHGQLALRRESLGSRSDAVSGGSPNRRGIFRDVRARASRIARGSACGPAVRVIATEKSQHIGLMKTIEVRAGKTPASNRRSKPIENY